MSRDGDEGTGLRGTQNSLEPNIGGWVGRLVELKELSHTKGRVSDEEDKGRVKARTRNLNFTRVGEPHKGRTPHTQPYEKNEASKKRIIGCRIKESFWIRECPEGVRYTKGRRRQARGFGGHSPPKCVVVRNPQILN